VSAAAAAAPRPIEALEGRTLMSASFLQTNLVADQPGVAGITDRTLTNAWGISAAPASGAFWVSASGSGKSELYIGDVRGSPIQQPFKVNIPGGAPTGQVFNINQPIMGTGNSTDFTVSDGTHSGASVFLFATRTGAVTGWNPAVGRQIPFNGATISGQAQFGFQAHDHAVYTGLAAGDVGSRHLLYAADFRNGKIDVIDGQFHKTMLGGSFTDPNLPRGFKPFNVQNLGGQLFVSYAKPDADQPGAASLGAAQAGRGKGFVDVFDTSGHLLHRVASGGTLNAPAGVAIAPRTGFGDFNGDLLVANNGDGHISAFDPAHNFAFRGQLKDAQGRPITISGLRALQFGNGVSAGDTNKLYFTAATGHGKHGLFGSLKATT
jgi:uncharacterized protein (TIGR03118 family)